MKVRVVFWLAVRADQVRKQGGNKEAARLSGIKVDKTLIIVYACMTVLATVAALMLSARLASGTPRVGVSGELDAIARGDHRLD